jgi:hypothetical protein
VPWQKVEARDKRFGVETAKKKILREGIEKTEVHKDADSCWEDKKTSS